MQFGVLQDGTRVVSDRSLALAFGRKNQMRRRITESGTQLPSYLSAGRLKAFLTPQLLDLVTKQITFRTLAGSTKVARLATVLPEICKVWLAADEAGVLSSQQKVVARRADSLLQVINKEGIDTFADRVTGYNAVAAREEVMQALELEIPRELMGWTRALPDTLFREFYRIERLSYEPGFSEKISYVGKVVTHCVFGDLPAHVMEDLRLSEPTSIRPRRSSEDHSPTADTGNKYLDGRIIALEATLRGSCSREDFSQRLPKVFRGIPKDLVEIKRHRRNPSKYRRLDLEP